MTAEPHPVSYARGPGPFPLPLHLKVLVVDDNRAAADTTAELLTICGADARACYDGPGAVAALAGFRPDACVLDLSMPGMTGLETAVCALAAARPPVLIALTALGDDRARAQTAAVGFDAHLVKPVDPAVLLRTLNELVGGAVKPTDGGR